MPYAINGSISTEPLDGAIEITEEQYRAAVDGVCDGMTISIEGGVLSIAVPAPPELPPEVLPTPDELRAKALAQRDGLMAAATARMTPLKYAVELGVATDAEEATLTAWKHYCVDLNRIEQQPGFPGGVGWPISPDTAS